MKPILVGLHNPLSADPSYALWPFPRNSSGDRLARMLGLTPTEYLSRFNRVNLLAAEGGGGALVWSSSLARRAREEACNLMDHYAREERCSRHWILLGARVTAAFGLHFEPMTARYINGDLVTVIPHPSGRCRKWIAPGAIEYVRRLATQSQPTIPVEIVVK